MDGWTNKCKISIMIITYPHDYFAYDGYRYETSVIIVVSLCLCLSVTTLATNSLIYVSNMQDGRLVNDMLKVVNLSKRLDVICLSWTKV